MTRPETTLRGRLAALDLVSFVAGLLALGVAVLYLAVGRDGHDLHPGAVASYAVGVLAVGGLLAGLRRVVTRDDG